MVKPSKSSLSRTGIELDTGYFNMYCAFVNASIFLLTGSLTCPVRIALASDKYSVLDAAYVQTVTKLNLEICVSNLDTGLCAPTLHIKVPSLHLSL